MKSFFKGPVFRALLALLALVVLSLVVWFLGPYLAIGDLHPLASVSMRVSAVVLLLATLLSWLWELPFALVGAAALCVLIWHGGPLLGVGTVRPLEPVWVRVLCIVLVVLALLVWGLLKLYRALQNDEKLLQRWLHKEGAQPALAKEEIRTLGAHARQAVAQLRKMHLTMAGGTGSVWSGLRRLVEGKRYLYELPWYVLIGQPGAGKSSVVVNSGLRFPLAEQMGVASARLTLEHAAGTQNCDWWLTNEAVLLDTAGRYTEQGDAQDEQVRQLNQAEWQGFLGVLRQVRPRAPVNGALLVVDVAQLLQESTGQRMALAAQLRARLEELRTRLGIRFPVYLVLAKADVLRGFDAYFGSLTSEARSQVWGFTLPWRDGSQPKRGKQDVAMDVSHTLGDEVRAEFAALVQRIQDGVAARLQEEFELDQRQALYLLPHEMAGLTEPVLALVEAVFADSRFDTTQTYPTLRGVYLTSAMQPGQQVTAQPQALLARLQAGFAQLGQMAGLPRSRASGASRRSYFLSDLLQRVVFAEAHLVKPNLRWEARMRLLRWIGHGVVLLLFFWLSGALTLSYHSNAGYLQEVSAKTDVLTEQMKRWLSDHSTQQTEKVLNLSQALPQKTGLDLAEPALSYRYGLYSAGEVSAAAQQSYGELLDRLVLPQVIAHMEQVMLQALEQGDSRKAYETLRAYLMLHDATRYGENPDNARDVRQWVTQEWQAVQEPAAPAAKAGTSSATATATAGATGVSLSQRLGNSASMVGHLEWLFSGQRLVQSGASRNEALVQQVRAFLDKNSSTERLYERAKSALQSQAPVEFSIVRALGPQAGTLFSRASGASLEKGVPGLFTYEGYHEVFAKKLPQMLAWAQDDDAWVMGKALASGKAEKKSETTPKAEQRELMEDIRRQYLGQYALLWTEFLADIRLVRSDKGGTLAFDLNILRQLAAADSPLVRLSRLAARETTLSRPLQAEAGEKSIFEKADEQLAQQKSKAATGLGMRPEQRAERQWVDDKFAALREVVTGQAEGSAGPSAGKAGLDTMTNALNEYYTVLVVADTAISAGSLPPAGTEAATKLRIEAGKLPAPLRDVLLDVSNSGADKVTQGASSILRVQAQAQMDRLVGMMALTVSEPCQRLIAGRYPFAASQQEVAADDFNAFFATGGVADEYFRKFLSPLVDTSVRPWRYKSPASANQLAGTEGLSQGQPLGSATAGPTLTGELLKLLSQSGPNPDAFAQIAQIRDMFFRESDGKRMGWRGEYKVVSLDAGITEWVIDFDGQVQRYAHGAVQTVPLQWPGPRGGAMAELHAHPRIKPDTSSISTRGPWAWLRLIERARLTPSAQPGRQVAEFVFDNRRALLEIGSAGPSPFNSPLLRNFSCPGRSS